MVGLNWKKDFPIFKQTLKGHPLVYLDTAATAQKPKCVIDALCHFYTNHYGTVHRAIYQLASKATEKYQETRVKTQKFLNAKHVEEIIFTKGTTESINLLASSFGKAFIQPLDEILVSEVEHHSNLVPWQMLCQTFGAKLIPFKVTQIGEVDLEDFKKKLSSKTKLVAVAHVFNVLGTIQPIEQMRQMAHHVGAKIFVDGAQSAPHLRVDVQKLGIDFFAFSGHKIYGPTGVGVLYGKKELLEVMPPYQGGGDMIETVSFEKTTYNQLPLKFEAGTPMIGAVIALGEALSFVEKMTLEKMAAWEHSLMQIAVEEMKQIPSLTFIGTSQHKAGIISFVIEGVHPLDLGTLLDLKGIAIRTGHLCSQPTLKRFNLSSLARISFGVYNTKEDIEAFISALKKAIPLLK